LSKILGAVHASSPVDKKSEYTKVNLKPVRIKEEIFIQFEEFKDKKAYT
jgi:hypothetical protein